MASSSDWLHFHQNNNPSTTSQVSQPYTATSATDLFFLDRASEPTMVSTTMSPISNLPPTSPAQLGPAPGRVSKPARKRTRASRRTPTTLLNTDTTNFRAMVQQFTGGSSTNFDIPGPGPQIYGNGMGPGYGMQLPMGQLQQAGLGPLQYAISSNNSNNINNSSNNNMIMQRMGEAFNNSDHNGSNNINVNVRLTGTGGRSSSTENRSINNFQF